jgi:hypothetical protein
MTTGSRRRRTSNTGGESEARRSMAGFICISVALELFGATAASAIAAEEKKASYRGCPVTVTEMCHCQYQHQYQYQYQ